MHPDLTAFARDLESFIQDSRPTPPSGGQDLGASSDNRFETLALRLFELQRQLVPAYARLCRASHVPNGTPPSWRDIPKVPAAGFKEFEVTSLADADRTRHFRSSGTTMQVPARHFHDTDSLRVYETSVWEWFRPHLLDTLPLRLVSLTPAPGQAPHSSLAHMLGTVAARLATPEAHFLGRTAPDGSWELDPSVVVDALSRLASTSQPLLLVGTAFGFVHVLDHLTSGNISLSLPRGSRIMETGGYKGRSRIVPRPALHESLSRHFAVPPSHIVSEYGMCELSSQAYDHVAGQTTPTPASRPFQFPPWARALVLDPESGREVPDGMPGLLGVIDLANVASVLAVQTEDLAIRRGRSFELVGRAPAAEPRGCSLLHA